MTASGQHWQASQGAMRPLAVVSTVAAVAAVALLAAALPPAWGASVAAGVAVLWLLAMWRLQWSGRRGDARWSDLDLLQALDDGAPAEPALTRAADLPELERFSTSLAAQQPWCGLAWAEVEARLRSQSDAWRQARSLLVQRAQRLRQLELATVLLEQGIPLAGSAIPDPAGLRAEAFLLRADPGLPVLREVAALQARRMRLAIEGAAPARRVALQAQWERLGALFSLMPVALRLRESRWQITRLAWNPQADLDRVDAAYVQASEYRRLLRDWLQAAASVVLADGSTLQAYLMAQCPALRPEGEGDDLGQVEAAQALWPAFQRQVDELLARLQAEADQFALPADAGLAIQPSAA